MHILQILMQWFCILRQHDLNVQKYYKRNAKHQKNEERLYRGFCDNVS